MEKYQGSADNFYIASALASPWWLQAFNAYGQAILLGLGIAYGILRLWVFIRDTLPRQPTQPK
jgi:hypothetical protein